MKKILATAVLATAMIATPAAAQEADKFEGARIGANIGFADDDLFGTSEFTYGAEIGYEINIYDTTENPDNRTGAIIRFSPPLVQVVAGEKWTKYEIKAEGTRIVVHLNGILVADLDDDTYTSGPIALQNNGGLIRFRNIRIRSSNAL